MIATHKCSSQHPVLIPWKGTNHPPTSWYTPELSCCWHADLTLQVQFLFICVCFIDVIIIGQVFMSVCWKKYNICNWWPLSGLKLDGSGVQNLSLGVDSHLSGKGVPGLDKHCILTLFIKSCHWMMSGGSWFSSTPSHFISVCPFLAYLFLNN
jgi:hypothetical protein